MGYFSQNYADFSQNYANYVAFYLRVDHILLPISSFLIKIWFLSVYNTNVVRPWLKVASFISRQMHEETTPKKIQEDPPEGRRGFASIGLLGRGHSPQSEAHIPQAAITPSTADPIGRKRRRSVAVKPLRRSADKAGESVPEPPHRTS